MFTCLRLYDVLTVWPEFAKIILNNRISTDGWINFYRMLLCRMFLCIQEGKVVFVALSTIETEQCCHIVSLWRIFNTELSRGRNIMSCGRVSSIYPTDGRCSRLAQPVCSAQFIDLRWLLHKTTPPTMEETTALSLEGGTCTQTTLKILTNSLFTQITMQTACEVGMYAFTCTM